MDSISTRSEVALDVQSPQEWLGLVAEHFARADVQTGDDELRASMRSFDADGLRLARVWFGAHVIERLPRHLQSGAGNYVLCVQRSGEGSLIVQDGRTMHIRPGDLAVYDTSRPYTLIHDEAAECLGLRIPRRMIPLPERTMRELTGRRFDRDDPLTRLVHELVQSYETSIADLPKFARHRATRSMLELTETLFVHQAALAGRGEDPRRERFNAVLEMVDSRLADDELGPEQLAAASHMSVRTLQALAQDHGVGIAAWIRRRRLERCRDDLGNPALQHLPIAQIGSRWGLSNAAHFSTLFRIEYGMTPGEYRRSAAGEAQPVL